MYIIRVTFRAMGRFGEKVAYGLNYVTKSLGNLLAWGVRRMTKVKPRRVVCWAYNFKQYGCNPRYLTEYLLENCPDFEVCWVFRSGVDTSQVDQRVKVVRFRTWEYLKMMATAEFLVTNSRTNPYLIYWHKRPEQKYLMLWHGGVALKKIERDVEDKLGYGYVRKAQIDSRVADLMISGCNMHTELIRNAFWYDGEVLERGIPRNDIFFDKERHAEFRRRVEATYGLNPGSRIVLYAPTFRRSMSIEPYRIDWSRMIAALRRLYATEHVSVIVRMHPNLIGKVDTTTLVAYEGVVDGTRYHDMQELLTVADMLITDYSSSMFDFTMQGRPCLLYATDVAQYDRGYYFDFRDLPYPLAETEDELVALVENFDMEVYAARLNDFFAHRVGLKEEGHAAQALAEWMARRAM